jgi:uncharacterized protein (TIGR02266 family)
MRTPITLKIKFKSASLGQFIERYSVDVSRSGIFIRTKEPLPIGTQLKFEFQLQDASSLIAGEGTVVWTREHDPARTGVAPGMGVRFDKLSGSSQSTLDQILAEKGRRGDAAVESRFDAGVRAAASSSGTAGDRDATTPLPSPMPGLGDPNSFDGESTRVMKADESRRLADITREEEPHSREEKTMSMDAPTTAALTAAMREAGTPEPEQRTMQMQAPMMENLVAKMNTPLPSVTPPAIDVREEDIRSETPTAVDTPAAAVEKTPVPSTIVVQTPPAVVAVTPPAPAATAASVASEPRRASSPPAKKKSSAPVMVLGVLGLAAAVGAYFAFRGDDAKPDQPTPPVVAKNPTPAPNPMPTPTPDPTPAVNPNPTPPENPQVAVNPTPPANPTPPPAPVPTGIEVAVNTTPPGATIVVDGKPIDGVTPLKVPGLEAKKSYELFVTMKGYKPAKQKFVAAAGKPVAMKLTETEKFVEVTSVPDGADVLFDGKKVGKTGKSVVKIKVTSFAKGHELSIRHTGFVKDDRTIANADNFTLQGERDVLAVAATLVAEEKPVASAPIARLPKKGDRPKAEPKVDKPGVEPVAAKTEEPPKPEVEKPKPEPVVEKPKPEPVVEKPKPEPEKPKPEPVAEKPKPEPEKPKPEEPKPEEPKAPIKVPSWMQKKPPATDPPPAQ